MSIGLAVALALSGCMVGPGARERAQAQAAELPPISPNRPTFSDGTTLVPVGHAQLETGYTFTKRSEGGVKTERHNAPEVTARYRALEALELRILWAGQAWSETESAGVTTRDDGGTDLGLAAVVPITEQDGWRPALALELVSTLGIGSSGFCSGHADPAAKLLWSYGAGHLPEWLGVGGNLIVAYPTEAGDRFTQTAVSLYATVTPGAGDTTFFGEWYVITPYANNLDEAQSTDFGVVHRLSRNIAVDARVGFGLDARADDLFAGFGISFLF
ncbi:MAG: transporter [Planctomycetes bacterium]|nr:transporter [Planctomycetota bacterium]